MKRTPSDRRTSDAGTVFVERDEGYSDPEMILEGRAGPKVATLLRVQFHGESKDSKGVVGYWFLDDSTRLRRRIPSAGWRATDEARAWSAGKSWWEAWEESPEASWMLSAFAYARPGLGIPTLVRVACACARECLSAVPAEDPRPRRALEAAESWCARDPDYAPAALHAVRARALDARAAWLEYGRAPETARGAESASFAAYHAALSVVQDAANAAGVAASSAAWSLALAQGSPAVSTEARRRSAARHLADLVRREVTLAEALRAVVGS